MSFILKGLWFLSDKKSFSDKSIIVHDRDCREGTLTIDDDNYILEITGTFDEYQIGMSGFTINGNTVDGKAVTLFNCINLGGAINSNAFATINKYIANSAAISKDHSRNGYIDSFDDLTIDKFLFSSINLNEWKWNSNFKMKKHNWDYKPGEIYSIEYEIPINNDPFLLADDVKFRIMTNATLPGFDLVMTERKISENNYIELSGENIAINHMMEYMYKVLDFLSIAIGNTQSPMKTSFIRNKVKFEYYFTTTRKSLDKKVLPQRMFFTYRDIENDLKTIIVKWIESYNQMKDIYQLFFSLCIKQGLFVNERFLFLVQFLESFHRQANPITEDVKAKWLDDVKSISSETMSKERIKEIQDKLSFGYEPTLKNRLSEILDSCSITPKLLGEKKNIKFIRQIIDTRNYLTHYGKKSVNVLTSITDLHETSEIMEKLSRFNLLKSMNFSDENVTEILSKYYRLK